MNWKVGIDKVTEDAKLLFIHLAASELNWKPNPNTWSIAQNLEHLIVVNETYFPILDALKACTYKTPFMAKFGFIVSFSGKTVLKAVKPERKKKMKTFPIWEPSNSNVQTDILLRFEKHQNELKRRITDAEIFINKGCVISSPANKNIVYKLETAFDIIVSHEQRHLVQASEILDHLKNTSR